MAAVAAVGGVTDAPVTAEELRTVDLFDDLDDEQLAEWVAVAHAASASPPAS